MITPNKVVTLEDSAMGLSGIVLGHIDTPIDVVRLYELVSGDFDGIDQFMLTLDVLYVIGRIDVNFKTRIVSRVD